MIPNLIQGEFNNRGVRIFGVSKDDCGSHKAFITKFNLNFPLLADTDGSLYKAFGIPGRTTVIVEKGTVKYVFPKVTPKGTRKALPTFSVLISTVGHAADVLSKL